MADVATDSQPGDGKVKEIDSGLLPSEVPKERNGKAQEERDVLEPIMVKDASGKKCVYYFEEGSHHLLEVIEGETDAVLPGKVQRVEVVFKRMWREILSVLRVITSFVVLLVVELLFYLAHYLFQPLVLNSLATLGNHLLKPLMIAIFNNIVQPIFAFVWNVLNAVVTALNPAVELVFLIMKQIGDLLKSVRLFHVNYYSGPPHPKLETV